MKKFQPVLQTDRSRESTYDKKGKNQAMLELEKFLDPNVLEDDDFKLG